VSAWIAGTARGEPAVGRYALDADIAERVAHLRLRARHVVEGLRSGLHRSPHRGASVIFAEHREYRPGDDLRLLDWRAFARSDRYAIKRFEQETHLRAHLVLDASGSMDYEGDRPGSDKAEHARTLLGALGLILLAQGDAVAGHVIDVDLVRSVPPRARPDHLEAILRLFVEAPRPRAHTRLLPALTALAERIGRRSLVIVASDLLDFEPNALEALALLKARGHDVRVFHVLHADELDFDLRERARFEDPESDAWLEVDPPAIRDAYRGELARFLDECRRRCVAAGAHYALARTDRPVQEVLASALGRHLAAG
jgi:uncharacterized protein (DUF58 family)